MPKQIEVAGQRMFVPSPPTLLPRWLDLPDGYVTVETPLASNAADGALLITRVDLQGDTVYSRTLHYRPLPYTSADLDSIAARGARGEPGGGVPFRPGAPPPDNWEAIAARYRAEMDYPAFQPPLEYVWVGQDQSVWLKLTRPGDAPTATWVALNGDGQPRARVELPAKASIRWSRGDTFWAVEPDELDTPFLVRYRIGS